MDSILDKFKEGTVLFDGGMGTQLIAAGMKAGDSSERWNLDHAEALKAIHTRYREAGADVLTTNTFGATRGHLERHRLSDRLSEINATAARIAREAAGDRCLVAGDLGPTGLMFPPMGKADPAAQEELYAEQAKALADAGVDLLLIETQVDLREALAAVKAAKKSKIPVGVTLTFNSTPRGYFTLVGDKVETCCAELAGAGADFLGANCTLIPQDMLDLAKQLCDASDLPILIQPNAGQPEVQGDSVIYRTTPDEFTDGIRAILETGVAAVGGCCGTDPETIRALRDLIDSPKT
jgi:5-methyltetrahydrofolate--homocysteine methyltransferase